MYLHFRDQDSMDMYDYEVSYKKDMMKNYQNILLDKTGHVKITDYGIFTLVSPTSSPGGI